MLSDVCHNMIGVASADGARSLALAWHAARLALSDAAPDAASEPGESSRLLCELCEALTARDCAETWVEEPGGMLEPGGNFVCKLLQARDTGLLLSVQPRHCSQLACCAGRSRPGACAPPGAQVQVCQACERLPSLSAVRNSKGQLPLSGNKHPPAGPVHALHNLHGFRACLQHKNSPAPLEQKLSRPATCYSICSCREEPLPKLRAHGCLPLRVPHPGGCAALGQPHAASQCHSCSADACSSAKRAAQS